MYVVQNVLGDRQLDSYGSPRDLLFLPQLLAKGDKKPGQSALGYLWSDLSARREGRVAAT